VGGRSWTQEEIEYVSEHVGIKDYTEMSHKLNRSRESIKLYRCRHKLPKFIDNFYSYSLLAAELGRSRATLRKYHKLGWLTGRRATWACVYGKHPMIFVEDDIVEFLKKFHHKFNWRDIPNPYFRNIVEVLARKGLPKKNS